MAVIDTLNTIAYDYLTSLKQLHDDTEFDIRQIKFWIKNSRAVWVKNELNKPNSTVSTRFRQNLGCTPMQWAEASACGLTSDYKLKRTVLKIPVTVETKFEPTFTRIGPSMIADAAFTFVVYERLPFVGSRRFNLNTVFAFSYDDYIWLACKGNTLAYNMTDFISIQGVFADPTQCAAFTKCDNTPVYTDDTEYPITAYLIAYMKDILLQSIDVKMMLTLKPDQQNNAHDDQTASQTPQGGENNQQ